MTEVKWEILFSENCGRYYSRFDKSVKDRIKKKIEQMENDLPPRGLYQSKYLVEEVGQYRIAYILREGNIKEIHFIGDHTQYKKWYSSK